jgi:hypothetical protein
MHRLALSAVLIVAASLAGCDMLGGALGIESPEKVAASRDAEGKAVGGACRHAGRAIEDCYTMNKKADKAAVFAGWRDMNDYMRENKIEPLPPQIGVPTAVAKGQAAGDAADAEGASADGAPAANAAAHTASRGHVKPAKAGGRSAKAHDS